MKRDLGVVRTLLMDIERVPSGKYFNFDQQSAGLSKEDFDEYLKLMEMDGLIYNVGADLAYGSAFCEGLSPKGHDFLDKVRSDTIWNAVLEKAKTSGVALSVAAAGAMAKAFIEEKLGIKLP